MSPFCSFYLFQIQPIHLSILYRSIPPNVFKPKHSAKVFLTAKNPHKTKETMMDIINNKCTPEYDQILKRKETMTDIWNYRVFLFDDMFLTSSCGRNFDDIDMRFFANCRRRMVVFFHMQYVVIYSLFFLELKI